MPLCLTRCESQRNWHPPPSTSSSSSSTTTSSWCRSSSSQRGECVLQQQQQQQQQQQTWRHLSFSRASWEPFLGSKNKASYETIRSRSTAGGPRIPMASLVDICASQNYALVSSFDLFFPRCALPLTSPASRCGWSIKEALTEREAVRYKQANKKNMYQISLWNDRRRAEDEFTSERFSVNVTRFSPVDGFSMCKAKVTHMRWWIKRFTNAGNRGRKTEAGRHEPILILHHREGEKRKEKKKKHFLLIDCHCHLLKTALTFPRAVI